MAKNHKLVRTMRTVMSRKPAFWAFIFSIHKNLGHFLSLLFACELVGPPDPARAHSEGVPRVGNSSWHGDPANLIRIHEMYRGFFGQQIDAGRTPAPLRTSCNCHVSTFK